MTEVIKTEDCIANIGDYDVLIHNAIIVPKGVTNGDMILTIFPNVIIKIKSNTVITNIDNGCWFSLDWWNTLYKAESDKESEE